MLSPTFRHVPCMKQAASIPERRVEDLTQEMFFNDFVLKSQPCVIKSMACNWPASQKWRDKEYLKSRSGHHQVYYYPHENYSSLLRQVEGETLVGLGEALDRLQAPDTRIGFVGTATPVEWLADIGAMPFLGKVQPAFFYPFVRYFLYRDAGTTWHYHPFDETLMCQVIGAKKVGLLRLENPHRLAVRNIFFKEDYYEDASKFAGFEGAELDWHHATVEEGDALYIPPLWWHGVVPVTSEFGVTAAIPWRSPLPVIAESIRKMAAGQADIIGKTNATHVAALIEVARQLGLEKELAIAWERGN
ncbi:MAG TPA: cupin-like domain-containing protein [Rhizomicrobium sp.]|nr:cupin-like domain-containing protein [Rhizomicrobium sp.]